MKQTIRRVITVKKTPIFHQHCGKFDLRSTGKSVVEWDVDVQLPADWSMGVIVGPSMAGKSTLAGELFPGGAGEPGRLALAERPAAPACSPAKA